MDAALELASSAPTARALVLTRFDRARAWQTTDGRKALSDQGMARQSRVSDIFQDVARAPADQRIDLDPLALRLEQRQGCAQLALKTLSAGDPGVISFNRLGKRTNLSKSRSTGPDRS